MDVVHLVGRILVSGFFLYNAVNHLFLNTGNLEGYARAKGTPAPRVAVVGTGLLLLVGGLSLLFGFLPVWGIALLTVFLVGVSIKIHDYWNQGPESRQMEQIQFMKNVAILGALWALAAFPQPWPFSLSP